MPACACACVILSGFVARRLSAKMSILLESQPLLQPQFQLRLRCALLRLLLLFPLPPPSPVASVVVVMNDAAFGRVFCLAGTIYKTQTLAATQRDRDSDKDRDRERDTKTEGARTKTQSDLNGLCQAERISLLCLRQNWARNCQQALYTVNTVYTARATFDLQLIN